MSSPLWLDKKYINLLSAQLPRFKWKSEDVANARCVLCGDSEVSKTKARSYIYKTARGWFVKCHNCGVALPFSALLKRQDKRLYDEYMLDRFKESQAREQPEAAPEKRPEPATKAPPSSGAHAAAPWPVYPLSTLSNPSNPLYSVYGYAKEERKLPTPALARLFATNQAHSWLLPLVGEDKAAKVSDGHAYLVQPLRLTNGDWYGAQLRLLARKEYLTFRWSHGERAGHEPLKVFGLDAWTPDALTYVVEGPIDALFVPNALATCGSDLLTGIRVLEEHHVMSRAAPRVYVWDNEPKNKEIVRHLRHAIQLHERVVIWPCSYPKDINDMVRAGYDVQTLLVNCTYHGLSADVMLSAWLKGLKD